MADVLIIDPSPQFCRALAENLRALGHSTRCAATLDEGLRSLSASPASLVSISSHPPDSDGSAAIPALRQMPGSPHVIVLADAPSPDEAEAAVKNGAWDYVPKQISLTTLSTILDRAARHSSRGTVAWSGREFADKHFEGIIGSSPQLRSCLDTVARAANSDANVLIKGETGTGKELIAWAIHRNSPRSQGNFVVVDCAALPETLVESTLLGHEKGAFTGADRAQSGLIKQADGGTLFLDEIGELPVAIQKSFLRVLEERRFRPIGGQDEIQSNFRLISASNRDLDESTRKSEFREDLLFRIRSFTIDVPPLRQRMEDIRPIVMYHMPRLCERLGVGIKEISEEFYETLLRYTWPGNVRELVNALERALVAAQAERVLLPQHLPTYLRVELTRSFIETSMTQAPTLGTEASSSPEVFPDLRSAREAAADQAEHDYLQKLILVTNGNIKDACSLSKLSRSRLYSLLKKHHIKIPR